MTDRKELQDAVVSLWIWVVFLSIVTGILWYQLHQIKDRLPAPQAGQVEVQK